MKRYETPNSPMKIEIYFCLDIFSSFRSIFNQTIVKTGAELIKRVTRPEEMYWRENIKNHPTKNIEAIAVMEASLRSVESNLSRLKME